MCFPSPLLEGRLIKRYKRFLADIELESGEIITAHCGNSGSMLTLNNPGMRVWVSKAPPNSNRKLKYTWELVKDRDTLVGIFPAKANDIVQHALEKGHISELSTYKTWRREVPYAQKSRIDFLLQEQDMNDCYVEIKSVQMKRQESAEFPDAATQRGVKHLDALISMVEAGHRAVVFYCVQRVDCQKLTLAADIDPLYALKSKEAQEKGVEMIAYNCHISFEKIFLNNRIEIL